MVNIFSEWDSFETALKDTFGMATRNDKPAMQIYEIRQIKSAAPLP
jgi:hypothetical protein